MLRWAGYWFGEEETLRLQASLKQLLVTSGAKHLRFWGKIHGSEKDYYIAEGEADADADEGAEPLPDFEPRGSGVNTLTYWVSSSPLQPWTVLPDITPAQLNSARQFRHLFSGNLDAPIVTNPHFAGKERELLRCQITRITHSTVIIPRGLFKVNEEEPQTIETPEDEVVVPSTFELNDLSNWVHYHQGILMCNRLVHMEPEPQDDQDIDPEELMAKIREADPFMERLKPIFNDVALPGYPAAWANRLVGDTQLFELPPPKKSVTTNAVNVIRSLWWPGAFTVQQNGVWINFYVGDGLKAPTQTYYPTQPPVIVMEPADPAEMSEPTPKERPKPEKVDDEDS
jgi:radial spoke head protein 4A